MTSSDQQPAAVASSSKLRPDVYQDGGDASNDQRATVTLRVGGMTCGACVESIESMLRKQDGIHSVSVALLAERAVVDYSTQQWSATRIADEIEDIGFEAEVDSDIQAVAAGTSDAPQEQEALLAIYGMTCSACVASIETTAKELPGVIECEVALATERAKVRYDTRRIGLRQIVERIEDAGFDVVVADDRDSTQLQSLSRVKEVTEWRRAFMASISMAIPVFLISMVFSKWPPTHALLFWQPIHQLYLIDVLTLGLTIPVQFGVGRRFYRTAWKSLKHKSATMDVLVVFGTTASFTYSALSMLFALFCAAPDHCGKPTTFFDTSTMLITFVSFGRYLENTAKGKTSEALSRLMGLAPTTAIIYTDGEKCSKEKRVPGELVQCGDYVKAVPGERIPADGVVVRGSSIVDESVVTGESMPVTKKVGSQVIGGTVNGLGTFDFLVERAGKDTSLSQIVRLVSEAQTGKAPIQAFADRIAGVFVPCVIALGLLTFICWMFLAHMLGDNSLPDVFHDQQSKFAVCLKLCISVVVVACPCALGLATPTAVMVGTGVGAQNGILIKGGGPLEASVHIRKILFDKTGTLTQGKVSVVSEMWAGQGHSKADEDRRPSDEDHTPVLPDIARRQALQMIAALENRSEHPLGRSIAAFAAQRGALAAKDSSADGSIVVESFESIPGRGVIGSVQLATSSGQTSVHRLSIGNTALLDDAAIPSGINHFARLQERQARTLVYVSIDDQVVCAVALADDVKPEAVKAIAALHAMGISTALVTGDTEVTARAVASRVGISPDAVFASRSPSAKSDLVAEVRAEMRLQNRTAGIAFVGDGINDSPALASADVGIAMSSGSDIALESASIVLVRNSLLDVPCALVLARRIFMQIRLNFAWATCYNIVALPLAMGFGLPWGWKMHPMMAGAAMAASSVSVVCGSLTLRWWKRPARFETAATSDSDDPLAAASSGNLEKPNAMDALAPTTGLQGHWWMRIPSTLAQAWPWSRSGARGGSAAEYQALPAGDGEVIEMA
ncbi:unnamed protein product [Jaminaea pallidilutea]